MWIVSIAEIDERHVARELRRKPVSNLGLARLPACECVSDAEPRWLSQGISGGCEVSSLALVLGRAEWTRRWKALRAWKTTAMVCRCAKGPRCCSTKPGLGWEGRAVRQGASVTRSRGLRKVRQGPTRVMSGPDGRRRQPLCRGATIMVTAGAGASTTAPHEVGDAACGYPAPSNRVLLPKRARGCGQSGAGPEAVVGTARAQRSGLERSGRCSLTTSRLQRLATGAFLSEGWQRLGAAGYKER